MSEDPDVFLNYIETSQERERVLALLYPDVRAVVEQYMGRSPGHQCQEGHQRNRRVWRDYVALGVGVMAFLALRWLLGAP